MQKIELQWEGQQNIRRKHRESNEYSTWQVTSGKFDRKSLKALHTPKPSNVNRILTLASLMALILSLHSLV
jgi:hypothetical protein